MPTLAAAAGAPLPTGVTIDGRNLLPALTGQGAAERADAPLFWNSGYYKAVRAGDWKLQINEKQGKAWLYNLTADPHETTNLAATDHVRRKALEALIAAHHRGRRAALYPSTFSFPVSIDSTLATTFKPGEEFIYWPN
jgi:uncharacterized sulfatase